MFDFAVSCTEDFVICDFVAPLVEMRNMSDFEEQGLVDFNVDYSDIALIGSAIQQKINIKTKEIQHKFFLKLPF